MTVNGFVQGGKVTINTNSKKYLNSVVGHEVMHVLEGSEHYKALSDAAIEFAKAAGEYDSRLESLTKLYGSVEGADVNAELVADLVGDYLFTDSKFIQNLSAEKPGLFKRLWDEVKYLCRTVTAKSPEAKKLLEVEKRFKEAYKDTKKAPESGEVRYSVGGGETQIDNGVSLDNGESPTITAENVQELRSIGRKSINAFTSEDIKKAEPWARKFYAELGTKSPFFRAWFGDWRAFDKTKAEISSIKPLEYNSQIEFVHHIKDGLKSKALFRGNIINKDTGFNVNIGAQVYNDTLTYANRKYSRDKDFDRYSDVISLLDDVETIVSDSVLLDTVIADEKGHENRTFIHYLYSLKTINDRQYIVKLVVDELQSNDTNIRRAYSVDSIKISPVAVSQVLTPADTTSDISGGISTSTISIADLHDLVKTYDKEFSPKDVNPALLNEDGTPKVFYHGTNAEFWAFDKSRYNQNEQHGDYVGEGFFFADTQEKAQKYGSKTMPAYLRMENPLVINSEEDAKIYREMFRGMFDGGNEKLREIIGGKYDYYELLKSNPKKIREYLQNNGYDGLIDNIYGQYAVFEPAQIKSATDNIGTFDGKNPDIRYSVSLDNAIAPPVKGDLKISGDEIRLPDDTPIRSDIGTDNAKGGMDNDIASIFKKKNPFNQRDIKTVGKKRKLNAFMFDNPDLKHFFQDEAHYMLNELDSGTKGARVFDKELANKSTLKQFERHHGLKSIKRNMPPEIEYLRDECDYTYDQIRQGLNDIIEDNGAENNAVSKKLEILINKRLTEGYTSFTTGEVIEPNKNYIYAINKMTSYSDDPSFDEAVIRALENDGVDLGDIPIREDVINTSGFGVTQDDINDYVDRAGSKTNSVDHLKYAEPSERLIQDVQDEIDISGYIHTLRDNDIRHIYNSHGEKTNEKYPITPADIKAIPNIVYNYDKVFVVKRAGKDVNTPERTGIIYVKVNKDNTVYYLEQATDQYHNENLLVNKQMIKVGLDDIPKLKGLEDAITKKQSKNEYLADLNKARKVYVQDATQSYSNGIISNQKQNVKRNDKISENAEQSPEVKEARTYINITFY